ncbi:MAG: hypothetical protein RR034_08925 [Bacteroidales bacterium]
MRERLERHPAVAPNELFDKMEPFGLKEVERGALAMQTRGAARNIVEDATAKPARPEDKKCFVIFGARGYFMVGLF